MQATLADYPLVLTTGRDHVAALSDALDGFGRGVRIGIEEMNELEEAKWLWFVEAHQQAME